MKNIVLCFDHTDERPGPRDATNTELLFRLLDSDPDQIGWYHAVTAPGALPRRRGTVGEAHSAIADAYRSLTVCWEPGDDIFLFGSGHGGHLAHELATLLGTIGLWPARSDDLLDYALATYALPRTPRTPQDWQRVRQLTEQLRGEAEIAVPVRFLGMWDTLHIPGARRSVGPLTNVDGGRHAVAIDGARRVMQHGGSVEAVWFRGAHCDIAGGTSACWPLADLALDWMLTGAVGAGLRVANRLSSPSELDALAGTAPTIGVRRPPLDARVHASVEVYLRAHPHYWRRLPARIEWADAEWLARGERLMPQARGPLVEPAVLTAVAS